MSPKPSGGKPAASRGGRPPSTAEAAAAAASEAEPWKRQPGQIQSGKSKKEYLKWKREQKRVGTDDEEAGAVLEGRRGEVLKADGGAPAAKPLFPLVAGRQVERGVAAGAEPMRKHRTTRARDKAPPNDEPLRYAPFVDLPGGDVSAGTPPAGCGGEGLRMARTCAAEVGFTAEGRALGMPHRPTWRGVVRSAEALHQLEERAFSRWCEALERQYGATGRLSFYEPRLEFWRQLWRVLERSEVALIIVDARNPLLHFSDALARHVLHEQQRQVVLVLNKSDLVPAAALDAWADFFHRRYPGLRVVVSHAGPASNGGRVAAEAILDAVLSCSVRRDHHMVAVADVVQATRDEVLDEAQRRNVHAKREKAPTRTQMEERRNAEEQRVRDAAEEDAGGSASSSEQEDDGDPVGGQRRGAGTHGTAQANRRRGAQGSSVVGGGGSLRTSDAGDSDGGDGWAVKGTKASKADAVRRKRAQRMHAGVVAAPSGSKGGQQRRTGPPLTYRQQQQQQEQAARAAMPPPPAPPAPAAALSKGHRTGGKQAAGGMQAGSRGWQLEAGSSSHSDGDARSGSGSSSGDEGSAVSGDDGDSGGAGSLCDEFERMADDDFNDGVGSSGGGAGAAGGVGAARPIVVCVVGEPNVGKSSTMNALLGTHRVAVSSHPGRTKHYQTHYMTERLMLCDCPGLVFPRLDVALPIQILFGSYPIARCRDPYAVIGYLAEHVWPPLHVTLGLRRVPEADSQSASREAWTALALCEAFAARHSWRLKSGGRLDTYRAANWILRSALAGKNGINLCFLPPADEELQGDGSAVA